ncbi:GIN domain-containing protein [Carboxylicivirga linearis]|uniref:DUF2807 domain-containing protein n=1 Tax=Carboxylicivirga linearis TaxID=1628157 RepID=A0ABS5K0T2_9BACT|nr:DUF2807 domain-containing protein [Carboxylicivirga linearis]MBS2100785.1 DUF2807 domain-containing protein [Carboxylicivirga linearis]
MRIIYCFIILLIFNSCEYINNLTTSSDVISKTIETDVINALTIETPCNVHLINNDSNEILISGQEHLLYGLILENTNNQLLINHEKSDYLQKSKLIDIQIPANKLENITVNSVMTLISEEALKSSGLKIVVNGTAKFTEMNLHLENKSTSLFVYGFNNSGNYTIYGTTENFNSNIEGTVNVYADDFQSKKINLRHKSIGRCNVFALDYLSVETYSSGNTYYRGEPNEISHEHIQVSNIKPTGQLIKF